MKKPLTTGKMLLLSVLFLLTDAVFFWLRSRTGTVWISPSSVKFLMKDLFLIVAWMIYFLQKKKP